MFFYIRYKGKISFCLLKKFQIVKTYPLFKLQTIAQIVISIKMTKNYIYLYTKTPCTNVKNMITYFWVKRCGDNALYILSWVLYRWQMRLMQKERRSVVAPFVFPIFLFNFIAICVKIKYILCNVNLCKAGDSYGKQNICIGRTICFRQNYLDIQTHGLGCSLYSCLQH